jgi:hypothetical protein
MIFAYLGRVQLKKVGDFMKNKEISTNMKRLKKSLKKVSKEKQPIAQSLFDELVFMENTLVKLKKQIEEEGATAMFKQGKQEFLREHPALKGYNTMVQRYSLLYKQITDLLPEEEQKEESDPLIDFIKGA